MGDEKSVDREGRMTEKRGTSVGDGENVRESVERGVKNNRDRND